MKHTKKFGEPFLEASVSIEKKSVSSFLPSFVEALQDKLLLYAFYRFVFETDV